MELAQALFESSELGRTLADQAIAALGRGGFEDIPHALALQDWLEEQGLAMPLPDLLLLLRLRATIDTYSARLSSYLGIDPAGLQRVEGPEAGPWPLTVDSLLAAMSRYEVETMRRPDRLELHPQQFNDLRRDLSRQSRAAPLLEWVRDADRAEEAWHVFGMRVVPNLALTHWRVCDASADDRSGE